MTAENKKEGKEAKKQSGLGRDLSDLLDDNDGIPNMKCNVLLRREDGKSIKIYDKTGGEKPSPKGSYSVKKR